jgi:glycosyltransferase family protein
MNSWNLAYGTIFKPIRTFAKYFFSWIYPIFIRIYPLPKIATIEETIDKLILEKCSICRFGDGELLFITKKRSLPFQRQDEQLRQRFIEILKSNNTNILVGLPIGFQTLKNLKQDVKLTWQAIVVWTYPGIRKYLDIKKQYYNASITRLYMGFEDTSDATRLFKKVRSIWNQRDIVLIEGEKSRLGVGNDLFENADSVKRILAPAHHAYSKYNEIMQEAEKHPGTSLILVALGPTAKPLVYDLAQRGFQAIDIGNLDTEYEWFRMGATSIIKIKGKYTSEAKNGREVEDVFDEKYLNEIISKIL